jgi:hypothetical protein
MPNIVFQLYAFGRSPKVIQTTIHYHSRIVLSAPPDKQYSPSPELLFLNKLTVIFDAKN